MVAARSEPGGRTRALAFPFRLGLLFWLGVVSRRPLREAHPTGSRSPHCGMGASVSQSGNYRRRAKGRDSARRDMRCPRPQSYEFPAGIALNVGVALRHQRRRVLARARVAFPCQLARFAGLLDSPVAVIPLSDAFDVRPHVLATRGDKEACAIAPDLLAFAVRVPRPQAQSKRKILASPMTDYCARARERPLA